MMKMNNSVFRTQPPSFIPSASLLKSSLFTIFVQNPAHNDQKVQKCGIKLCTVGSATQRADRKQTRRFVSQSAVKKKEKKQPGHVFNACRKSAPKHK